MLGCEKIDVISVQHSTMAPINAAEELASKLIVEYRPLASLAPYANNARTHSRSQVRKIMRSIETFTFVNPVLINRDNMIIAGHGRVEAARLLGMAEIPTIRLGNLTDDQVRALIIADNKIALDAGWNPELLRVELQYLLTIEDTVDISVTGFEIPEIDLIIGDGKPKEDPADDLKGLGSGPAVTQIGDLWRLGQHRILCGNSLEGASYTMLLGKQKADLAVADLPYNVPISGHATGKGVIQHREFAMASGEMSELEFTSFLTICLNHLACHSKDGSVHFLFMDWAHMGELLRAGNQVYDSLLNLCVWAKNNGGMGSLYRSQHELVFVFRNGKKTHRNNVQLGKFGRNRTNVWHYPNVATFSKQGDEGNLLALHPTVKPVALVADAILDCSARGDLVVDNFLGSGSTLLAAERVGRRCAGVEIDPLYVDVAIRRWQRQTGEDAVHTVSGKTFNQIAEEEERSLVDDPKDDFAEVGYGKPPKATQFRTGQSGNPRGRPKGSKNLALVIQRDGRQLVTVKGPRGVRSITKQEAAVMQIGNLAAQGNLAAARAYLGLMQFCESSDQKSNLPPAPHERDTAVMKNILERIRRASDISTVPTTAKSEPTGD